MNGNFLVRNSFQQSVNLKHAIEAFKISPTSVIKKPHKREVKVRTPTS